jgi:iron complex transport system ATP-binding protein
MTMLRLLDLYIGYKSKKKARPILSSVCLQAMDNDLIAVIGRNGIGKTTLLKTIAGILKPVNGKAELDSTDIQLIQRRDLAKKMSYVSTELVNSPNMTVYDLVALGRHPHTGWYGKLQSVDKEIIQRSIILMHLDHLSAKSLAELSDGERQRALIARALAQDTSIIIMDEPAAFLDVVNRYEVMLMLRKICRAENKTVIFSTHDLSLALHEADKIWLLLPDYSLEGSPEDMIMSTRLNDLFKGSNMKMIEETGQISLGHETLGYVSLTGDVTLTKWTTKALERMGYLVNKSADSIFEIHTGHKNEAAEWIIQKKELNWTVHSIYELSLLIRKIGTT